MAQINLLKQKSQGQNFLHYLPSILVKFLAVLLLAVLVYYVWLFVKARSAENEIRNLGQKIVQARSDVAAEEGRDKLLTRQAQLKELENLVSGHVYWSKLLPALSEATLKTASYSSLQILDDGDITLDVTVPTLVDLDKFLQVFDLPEFNKNFSNVRIGAFHKVPSEDKIVFNFEVRMKYNPKLIEY